MKGITTIKKATKLIALALAAVIVCGILVSCSTMLNGTYSSEAGLGSLANTKVSYTFSGSKVTITISASAIILGSSTTEFSGTYEISEATDGTQSITFTFEDEDASTYKGTKSFSQNKEAKTVTIDGITYTKAK